MRTNLRRCRTNKRLWRHYVKTLWFTVGCIALAAPSAACGDDAIPFAIRVVDAQTERGVPLVRLRTTAAATWYTDSQGIVAFHEPGWMNQRVFFYVDADGYELPADGFGFHGTTLMTVPGGEAVIKVRRTMIAERLYRVTGAGIYRDSILTHKDVPLEHPLLNAGVIGSDSVLTAVYRGRVYWFWGDTNRMSYPLGNFHVPGATSLLPSDGGLDPRRGINLNYFVDDKTGFAKETAHMEGAGPTWLGGLVVLPEGADDAVSAGSTSMYAAYVKIKPPMEVYRRGLCRWDDDEERFVHVTEFALDRPAYPGGHPFIAKLEGESFILFAEPLPLTRVPPRARALADLEQYETFTCLASGSRVGKSDPVPAPERDAAGRIVYGWKKSAPAVSQQLQSRMMQAGQLAPHERWIQLRSRDGGKEILAHAGSVAWNAYRRKWVAVFVEHFGESFLGEVWYAEADTPLGPWVYAVKVASHARYSFYNPKHHAFFDQEGGRRIFFEGTYAHTFSGNPEQKPWYDYNQLMYALDLADHRLHLPLALYESAEGNDVAWWSSEESTARSPRFEDFQRIGFFALDRGGEGRIAIVRDADGAYRATPAPTDTDRVVCYAPAADSPDRRENMVELFTVPLPDGKHVLRVGTRLTNAQRREGVRLGWVWPSPYRLDRGP